MAETIVVEFDGAVYSADALNAAAYRLLGTASCQIEKSDSKFICNLTPIKANAEVDTIRSRFIDLVTDERLREALAARTDPLRNLVLSLAFGSLAASSTKTP
jgi:His-Xaa-Ser system protein HxsD